MYEALRNEQRVRGDLANKVGDLRDENEALRRDNELLRAYAAAMDREVAKRFGVRRPDDVPVPTGGASDA
jgi:hypothetical protein